MTRLEEKLKTLLELGIVPTKEQLTKLLVDEAVAESQAKKPEPILPTMTELQGERQSVDRLDLPFFGDGKMKDIPPDPKPCRFRWWMKGTYRKLHLGQFPDDERHHCRREKGHDDYHICVCGSPHKPDGHGHGRAKPYIPRKKAKPDPEMVGEQHHNLLSKKMSELAKKPRPCKVDNCTIIVANQGALFDHWKSHHPAHLAAFKRKSKASKVGYAKCASCGIECTWYPGWMTHQLKTHKLDRPTASADWYRQTAEHKGKGAKPESKAPGPGLPKPGGVREDIVLAEIGRGRGISIEGLCHNTHLDGGAVYSIIQRLMGTKRIKAVKQGAGPLLYVLR